MIFPAYEEALRYLDAGLSFYPAYPMDKRPFMRLLPTRWDERKKENVPTWGVLRDRQPTIEECANWFKRRPQPNIVLITGKISNRIVLDIDDGASEEYLDMHFPGYPIVITGRGVHIHCGYVPVALEPLAIPGIEIKTDGHCCTLPPSVHKSGHIYQWSECGVFSKEAPPLPDWIIEYAKKKPRPSPNTLTQVKGERYAMAALQSELDSLASISVNRNREIFLSGLRLSRFANELGRDNIVSALESSGVSKGLSASEARSAANSGVRTGINKAA